jgi:hypothetical protein
MTVALKKAEATATNLGNKSNTVWCVKTIDAICHHSDGTVTANVITDVWETRAKFDACDPTLDTVGVNRRYSITIPDETEMSMTSILAEVKTGMESEGFTITNEV